MSFDLIHPSWHDLGVDEKTLTNIFESLPEGKITPSKDDVIKFTVFPPEHYSIIIIGQDPYPNEGVADGLAFSCRTLGGSTKNIQKCLLQNDLITKIPEHGILTSWMLRGVLLLNTSLTTSIGKVNAHRKYWSNFTTNLIKNLSETKTEQTFLLWGKEAESLTKVISNTNTILTHCHPSPQNNIKFLTCDHFNQVSPRKFGWGNRIIPYHCYIQMDHRTKEFEYHTTTKELKDKSQITVWKKMSIPRETMNVKLPNGVKFMDETVYIILCFKRLFNFILTKPMVNLDLYFHTSIQVPDIIELKKLKLVMFSVTVDHINPLCPDRTRKSSQK